MMNLGVRVLLFECLRRFDPHTLLHAGVVIGQLAPNGFSPSSCSRTAGIGYRRRNAARVAGARTDDQESVTEAAAMGALVQT